MNMLWKQPIDRLQQFPAGYGTRIEPEKFWDHTISNQEGLTTYTSI